MSSLSVVIPTKTLSNFLPCAEAVRQHEPEARIICVDDGLETRSVEGCTYLDGIKPFVFSRNVNIGLRAAGEDDCVILNDDAVLRTPNGFTLLQQAANHTEFGVIASTTNMVGNINQQPRGIGLREDSRMVCFIAVLLPRRTIDRVGLLDERFTAYGFEDDDYCYRVRQAGLKIGILDDCFVDHASLKSTFRGDPKTAGQLESGRHIFIDKWGSHPL